MTGSHAIADNAFALLSFLAAPAILTNASTLLALSTSNRLARASDRARAAAQALVAGRSANDPLVSMRDQDFTFSTRRAELLIIALRRFYLAAGCFAAGTCVALLGAFADYFGFRGAGVALQLATAASAILGVFGLMHGSYTLLAETRLAIRSLEVQHAAITQWRAAKAADGGDKTSDA